MRHTEEFKERIAKDVLEGKHNKLQASRHFGVTWKTVDLAVNKYRDTLSRLEYGRASKRLPLGTPIQQAPQQIELGAALRGAVREEVKKQFNLLLKEFVHGCKR